VKEFIISSLRDAEERSGVIFKWCAVAPLDRYGRCLAGPAWMTSFNILFPIVAILFGIPVVGALIARVWLY
jgi:hypothetical protein